MKTYKYNVHLTNGQVIEIPTNTRFMWDEVEGAYTFNTTDDVNLRIRFDHVLMVEEVEVYTDDVYAQLETLPRTVFTKEEGPQWKSLREEGLVDCYYQKEITGPDSVRIVLTAKGEAALRRREVEVGSNDKPGDFTGNYDD